MSPSPFLKYQQRLWTMLAVTLWLVIAFLSLLPGSERPHTGYSGNAEHVVAYLGTAAVTALAFRSVGAVGLVLPFSIASALLELAQLLIPGRSAGADNWLASTLGALAGVLLARLVLRPWLDRRLSGSAPATPHGRP